MKISTHKIYDKAIHKLKAKSTEITYSQIDALSDRMTALIENADPQFLKLGHDLGQIQVSSNQLLSETQIVSEKLSHNDHRNPLKRTSEAAKSVTLQLETESKSLENDLNGVEHILRQLDILNRYAKGIYKMGTYLKVVALNIGVESSRSTEATDMFGFFVTELKMLSNKVSQLSGAISEQANQSMSKGTDGIHTIFKEKVFLQKLTLQASSSINKTFDRIQEIIFFAQEQLQTLSSHAYDLNSAINGVIEAMQTHDIAKQQIEHIIIGLEELKNERKKGPDTTKVAQTLDLQEAQLRDVIGEIAGMEHSIREQVGLINRTTDAISELSLESGKKKLQDPLKCLNETLQMLSQIIKKGSDLRTHATSIAQDTATSTTSLSDYTKDMHDLSHDMNLKSLNAIIKSIHLGDSGKALEVLAQEVTKISNDSTEKINALNRSVAVILGEAEQFIHEERTITTQKNSSTQQERLDESQRDIERVLESFNEMAEQSRDAITTIRSFIRQDQINLNVVTQFKEELSIHLKTIQNLRTKLPQTQPSSNTRLQDNAHNDHYTMEKERVIHKSALTGSAAMISAEASPDIELFDPEFDTDPEESIPQDSTENESEKIDDNIELF